MKTKFEKELENLINKYSKENDSDTPDFILARYLNNCLKNFNAVVQERELWYGRGKKLSDINYIEPNDLNYKIPFEFDNELIGQNNEDKEGQKNIFIGHEIGENISEEISLNDNVEIKNGTDNKYIGRPYGQNFSPEIQDAIKKLNLIGDRLLKQIDKLKK